ncbi:MAG: dodecin family protein [Candidatus Krumholzibacteriia bacterium]
MGTMKVIEIMTESEQGWEDAAQKAVTEAAKSVRNIRSVYLREFTATVEANQIKRYRVDTKITFEVET